MVTQEQVLEKLKTVYDPEVGVNIVDLGLIYNVDIDEAGLVRVEMTLTTPGCPLHETLNVAIDRALKTLPGVNLVQVELVWDPPWTPDRITSEGRAALGHR
ncbi:MAG: metal-sulfur cluster assembly factor [Bacillota bacterium]